MRKRLTRKWKDRRGFTLSEMLVTVLILLMVSGVVAAGVPAAANAYRRVVDTANAQVLLSTARTALREQLASARSDLFQPKADGSTTVRTDTISYYSMKTMYTTLCSTNTGIRLQPYETQTRDPVTGDITGYTENADYSRYLVSQKASTENLHVEFKSVTYNNGMFTVTGLMVIRTVNSESRIVAGSETDVFYIRAGNMQDQ